MPTPLSLPRRAWGRPDADRRALLVHGLGSDSALMWRFGTALADDGWYAVAVDLRGHGDAPRALDLTIAAYAADVAATAPDGGGGWDLVLGHSLGGAAVVVAAASDPAWTARLVLIDPALALTDEDRADVARSQEQAFADTSVGAVRAAHPRWHPLDVELKAEAARRASRWSVEQTSVQNTPWNVLDDTARLAVPTHVLLAGVGSILRGADREKVLAHPLVTSAVVVGAGHSPHRDDADQTLALLRSHLSTV